MAEHLSKNIIELCCNFSLLHFTALLRTLQLGKRVCVCKLVCVCACVCILSRCCSVAELLYHHFIAKITPAPQLQKEEL